MKATIDQLNAVISFIISDESKLTHKYDENQNKIINKMTEVGLVTTPRNHWSAILDLVSGYEEVFRKFGITIKKNPEYNILHVYYLDEKII